MVNERKFHLVVDVYENFVVLIVERENRNHIKEFVGVNNESLAVYSGDFLKFPHKDKKKKKKEFFPPFPAKNRRSGAERSCQERSEAERLLTTSGAELRFRFWGKAGFLLLFNIEQQRGERLWEGNL